MGELVYHSEQAAVWQEDCLTAAGHYADGRFQLILTSTPYPEQRGFGLSVPEYFDWWGRRLEVLVPKLEPRTGVLVQVLTFKRDGLWFDNRLFEVTNALQRHGLKLINIYMWDKLNSPPSGNHQRADRNGWELCIAAARSEDYFFQPVRRPYSPKSATKNGRAKRRQPDVAGKLANGHRRLHPEGALQDNVLRMSSSGDKRPRAFGGSFPRPLARRMILSFSRPADWVLDPCCGAGTTLVEAVENGRRAVGFDVDEEATATAADWLQEVSIGATATD